MATFEEFVLYDILLELKDMLFNKEEYVCIYIGLKNLKQLITEIDEILFYIEAYRKMPNKRNISKIINERFLFINKKEVQNKLIIMTKNRDEAMFILGKKGKNIKKIAAIISKKIRQPIKITIDW